MTTILFYARISLNFINVMAQENHMSELLTGKYWRKETIINILFH